MPPFTHKRDHGIPASFWWTGNPTSTPTGTVTTWVGVRFHIAVAGRIEGLSFYDGWSNPAALSAFSLVALFDWATPIRQCYRAGHYQAQAAASPRWNTVWMRPWFRIVPSHEYMAVALYVGGGFTRNAAALASPVTRSGITYVSSFQTTALDLSQAALSENTNANAVDVIFTPD